MGFQRANHLFYSSRMRSWTVGMLALLTLWPIPAAGLPPHEDARAVLDRWLEAQNQGRFDEYRMFYDDKFTGVRRSGNQKVSFDRDGWLRDRKRMFAKPMTVAVDNVHIFANDRSARIVFTQRWSSGQYADTGPKELVLRRRAGGYSYNIVHEELFASGPRAPGGADLNAFRQFAFVVDGEVVVSMNPDDAWAAGPAVLEKRGSDHLLLRSRRAVDASKLPPEIAKLTGLPVRLMDSRGLRCEAKLGVLLLRGRAISDVENDGDDAWSEDAWNMSAHTLVAQVQGSRKACAGATWARAAALPMPAIATVESPAATLKRQALDAFQALPESLSIQRDFTQWSTTVEHKNGGPPRRWFDRSRHPPVIGVIRPGSGPAFVTVSATISEGGCADGIFNSLWALWEIDEADTAHPRLILRNQPDSTKTLKPTAAVDVDGDGTLELLFDGSTDAASENGAGQPEFLEHGIVRALAGAYVEIDGPKTPIDICPC
jgi:hypothetical protein